MGLWDTAVHSHPLVRGNGLDQLRGAISRFPPGAVGPIPPFDEPPLGHLRQGSAEMRYPFRRVCLDQQVRPRSPVTHCRISGVIVSTGRRHQRKVRQDACAALFDFEDQVEHVAGVTPEPVKASDDDFVAGPTSRPRPP